MQRAWELYLILNIKKLINQVAMKKLPEKAVISCYLLLKLYF